MSESNNNKQSRRLITVAKQHWLDDLYRRYWDELCRYLKARFGGGPPEPEDIAQAAFTKFATIDQPDKVQNPRAFLYRMVNNLMCDEYRRSATRERFVFDQMQLEQINKSAESAPESVLIMNEMTLSLEAALRDLDSRERDFLLLHRIQKLSYTEIAQRSGMSRNGVKAVIVKALGKCEASVSASSTHWPHSNGGSGSSGIVTDCVYASNA